MTHSNQPPEFPGRFTRHRSLVNAMVNVLAALVAYTHQPCKPSLNLSKNELKLLTK